MQAVSIERLCGMFSFAASVVIGILASLSAATLTDALLGLSVATFIGLVAAVSFEIRHRRVRSLHRKVGRLRAQHPQEFEDLLRKWWMRPFARFLRH
jgi:hypothetical protein